MLDDVEFTGVVRVVYALLKVVFNLRLEFLALLLIMKLGGAFPRDFEFFPGGKFLLAGLKMSGILRSYAYNSSKCTLEPVMDMAGLYRPLFIKFGNPA